MKQYFSKVCAATSWACIMPHTVFHAKLFIFIYGVKFKPQMTAMARCLPSNHIRKKTSSEHHSSAPPIVPVNMWCVNPQQSSSQSFPESNNLNTPRISTTLAVGVADHALLANFCFQNNFVILILQSIIMQFILKHVVWKRILIYL